MISTLNRYIAGRVLRGIGVAFIIVTAIIMLVDFVEGSRNLGSDSGITSLQLLFLTLLKAPKFVEQTIPFVVLFGVMGALYGMNRRSELIVLRASGLSAWRFLRPALWVTAVLGIMWSAIANPLASKMLSYQDAQMIKWSNAGEPVEVKDIWLREGTDIFQTVIHAKRVNLTEKTLDAPVFYQLQVLPDGATQFARRFDAKSAELVTRDYWQLNDVIENAPGEVTQRHLTISLPTTITLDDLQAQAKTTTTPPFWEIPAAVRDNERAGFSARGLRMQFNRLLALPIMLIAMTFIAAGVSMHLTRQGGTLRLLISGAALGFAVFFADSVISAFGEVATLPVMVASWSIPLLVLFAGIAYLSKIEDG
ncbi:LptF/LptG family permease [Litorimonas sp. RW-G-Af-16]|uniref:LptF/LptG family permease n=1 Tax=Litorimonas sp. RW-G-Af-16 TaxID=3241168 RepID=UPI00390C501C